MLTKQEFMKLNRKKQESLLSQFTTDFSKKDKENDLWAKYENYFSSNTLPKTPISPLKETKTESKFEVITQSIPIPKLELKCPNCGSVEGFKRIKGWDYNCENCGKGFSGFPPPDYGKL